MVFKKKTTKSKVTPAKVSAASVKVVAEVKDISTQVEKVMNFLGYDKKRALKYNYYVKSSKTPSGVIKEDKLMEIFKE